MHPETSASWFSRMWFLWVAPTLRTGHRLGPKLTAEHLPPLRPSTQPQALAAKLATIWDAERARALAVGQKPQFVFTIGRFYGRRLIWLLLSSVLLQVFFLTIPVCSGQIVRVIEADGPLWEGFAYVLAAAVCIIASSITQQHSWYLAGIAASDCWIAMTSLLFSKPVRLTRGALSAFTEGQLTNLIGPDSSVIFEVGPFFGFFMTMPFQALFSSALLASLLGWVFLIGLAILLVNTYIVERLGKCITQAQVSRNKLGDERNVLVNETIQGARTVKLYAWEDIMAERVTSARAKELQRLKAIARHRAIQQFLSFGVPTLAQVPVFFVYERVHGGLQASTIFAALAAFEYLNTALVILPNALNETRRMVVSLRRIGHFLSTGEDYADRLEEALGSGDHGQVAVEGEGAFAWRARSADAPAAATKLKAGTASGEAASSGEAAPASFSLALPGFSAAGGELVLVCGRVGSGKTSLCSALLGLLAPSEGTAVSVRGRVAYVPQTAFVMNATVRENILFGDDTCDATRYDSALRACALQADIAALPAGDETEVGERGITISGGQKQRVALARAAYAQPDVVILDDPLSAMDAHVGARVFESCIVGAAQLGGCTRIFCTNQLHFAPRADRIVFLEGGRIVEQGTFDDLLGRGGAFAALYEHVVASRASAGDQVGATETSSGRAAKATAFADTAATATAATATAAAASAAAASAAAKPASRMKELEVQEVVMEPPQAANGGPASAQASHLVSQRAGGKRSGGRLVEKEHRESGRIGFGAFWPLARLSGSVPLFGAVLCCLFCFTSMQYIVSFMLARWADAVAEAEAGKTDGSVSPGRLYEYIATVGVFAAFTAARGALCGLFFVRSSRALHAGMLRGVLLQPMRFFDTTPVGRILNRFTGDVMQADVALPRLFDIWTFVMGSNVGTIALACVVAPPMIVISGILIAFFYALCNQSKAN